MKKIINLLLALVLTANLAACWTEDIPEAGAARHQVTGLTATPGDEEVLLSKAGTRRTLSSTTPTPIRKP